MSPLRESPTGAWVKYSDYQILLERILELERELAARGP